jgi:hypothetical protein
MKPASGSRPVEHFDAQDSGCWRLTAELAGVRSERRRESRRMRALELESTLLSCRDFASRLRVLGVRALCELLRTEVIRGLPHLPHCEGSQRVDGKKQLRRLHR